jgi:hypothetical protein
MAREGDDVIGRRSFRLERLVLALQQQIGVLSPEVQATRRDEQLDSCIDP